ncbi:LysR family transcriptional regulator [Actinoplanes sp. SE50]|uniref:LysR family transcriptional regulator n=1 Tax=unclassified Actinoplanes TaxID=2626549 RepID=UPI00023ECD29|nr:MULTISPECIES: LysR family transcriptional regulator [unclassified Actinoplanes]AEV86035.1 putative RuBisCO transcriptional regulator [Actinoplanes sp. SE50/110]ATO84433.1 LysR family transcriptional regulator [Actinoplanes sp. SE50]SLM01843.1 LysR-family transcriptional regulator [Actinoplanes sp. SE50/110]
MIDSRRLQVLSEVARHGSFNRAAAELRLTPSAVSQQISALERSLGTPVVRRSTRGVALTEAGLVLIDAAQAITAELRTAQREIDRLATARTERLTVATFTSGGQRLLPPALTRFTAEHPGVELTVIESEPEDSLPLVRSGAAELALAYHFTGPPPVVGGDRSGLLWTPILDDPMWIVLPAGHPLAGAATLGLTDLAGERWVYGCPGQSDLLEHYAALEGLSVRVACRGTDYQFAQSLVRAGVGISMIPEVGLSQDRAGLVAVPMRPPGPCRYVGVATPRRRPSPLATALLATLREVVVALPPNPLTTPG